MSVPGKRISAASNSEIQPVISCVQFNPFSPGSSFYGMPVAQQCSLWRNLKEAAHAVNDALRAIVSVSHHYWNSYRCWGVDTLPAAWWHDFMDSSQKLKSRLFLEPGCTAGCSVNYEAFLSHCGFNCLSFGILMRRLYFHQAGCSWIITPTTCCGPRQCMSLSFGRPVITATPQVKRKVTLKELEYPALGW